MGIVASYAWGIQLWAVLVLCLLVGRALGGCSIPYITGPLTIPSCATNITLCAVVETDEVSPHTTFQWSSNDTRFGSSSGAPAQLTSQCISVLDIRQDYPTTVSVSVQTLGGCSATASSVFHRAVQKNFPVVRIEALQNVVPSGRDITVVPAVYDYDCGVSGLHQYQYQYQYQYQWTVEEAVSHAAVQTKSANRSQSFVIPHAVLSAGRAYVVRVSTSFNATGVLAGDVASSEYMFYVASGNLTAAIAGGNRTISRGYAAVFDASISVDPDGLDNAVPRDYSWTCSVLENNQKLPQDDCLLGTFVQTNKRAQLVLEGTDLVPFWKYRLTVVVTVGQRSAASFVDVTSSPDRSPFIVFTTDFTTRVNANESLKFKVSTQFPAKVSFWWTSTTFNLSDASSVVGGTQLSFLTFIPNALPPGSTQIFECTASAGGTSSRASYQVLVNWPPENGTLEIFPSASITAWESGSVAFCSGWQDREKDFPLEYALYYSSDTEDFALLQDFSQNRAFRLPGLSEGLYTLRCRVRDALGSFSDMEKTLNVTANQQYAAMSAAAKAAFLQNSAEQASSKAYRAGSITGYSGALTGPLLELNKLPANLSADYLQIAAARQGFLSLLEVLANMDVPPGVTIDSAEHTFLSVARLLASDGTQMDDATTLALVTVIDIVLSKRPWSPLQRAAVTSAVECLGVTVDKLRREDELVAVGLLLHWRVSSTSSYTTLQDLFNKNVHAATVLSRRYAVSLFYDEPAQEQITAGFSIRAFRGSPASIFGTSHPSGDRLAFIDFAPFASVSKQISQTPNIAVAIIQFSNLIFSHWGSDVDGVISTSSLRLELLDVDRQLEITSGLDTSPIAIGLPVKRRLSETVGFVIKRSCYVWEPRDSLLNKTSSCTASDVLSSLSTVVCQCTSPGFFVFQNELAVVHYPDPQIVFRYSKFLTAPANQSATIVLLLLLMGIQLACIWKARTVDQRQAEKAKELALRYETVRQATAAARNGITSEETGIGSSAEEKWWTAARKSTAVAACATTADASPSQSQSQSPSASLSMSQNEFQKRRREYNALAAHRSAFGAHLVDTEDSTGLVGSQAKVHPEVSSEHEADIIAKLEVKDTQPGMFSSALREMSLRMLPATFGIDGVGSRASAEFPNVPIVSLTSIAADRRPIVFARLVWKFLKNTHMVLGVFYRPVADLYTRTARVIVLFTGLQLIYFFCVMMYYLAPSIGTDLTYEFPVAAGSAFVGFFLAISLRCVFSSVMNKVRDERLKYSIRKRKLQNKRQSQANGPLGRQPSEKALERPTVSTSPFGRLQSFRVTKKLAHDEKTIQNDPNQSDQAEGYALDQCLTDLFHKCDADDDGLVVLVDLQRVLKQVSNLFTDEIVATIFEEMADEESSTHDLMSTEPETQNNDEEGWSAFRLENKKRSSFRLPSRSSSKVYASETIVGTKRTSGPTYSATTNTRSVSKQSFMRILKDWYAESDGVESALQILAQFSQETGRAALLLSLSAEQNQERKEKLRDSSRALEQMFLRSSLFRSFHRRLRRRRLRLFHSTIIENLCLFAAAVLICLVFLFSGYLTANNFLVPLFVLSLCILLSIITNAEAGVIAMWFSLCFLSIYFLLLSPADRDYEDSSFFRAHQKYYGSLVFTQDTLFGLCVILYVAFIPLIYPPLFKRNYFRHFAVLLFIAALIVICAGYIGGHLAGLELEGVIYLGAACALVSVCWYSITRSGYPAAALLFVGTIGTLIICVTWMVVSSSSWMDNSTLTWAISLATIFVLLAAATLLVNIIHYEVRLPPKLPFEYLWIPFGIAATVQTFCMILSMYWGFQLENDRQLMVLEAFAAGIGVAYGILDPIFCFFSTVIAIRGEDIWGILEEFFGHDLGGNGVALALKPFHE
eukprot:ANDGO_07478.mRNA.1 hypothetical protein PPTG_15166